jgi:hypothetical protein
MYETTFRSYLIEREWNDNSIEYEFIKTYPQSLNILPESMGSFKKIRDILKEHLIYIDDVLFKNTWLNYFKWLLENCDYKDTQFIGR